MHDAEEIYEIYPRHVAKRAAVKSIGYAITRIREGETGKPMTWSEAGEFLKQKTLAFAESDAGKRGEFTPHATTWFNQGRYLDDPKEWGSGKSGGKCGKHPESALTQWGSCWDCYVERFGSTGGSRTSP